MLKNFLLVLLSLISIQQLQSQTVFIAGKETGWKHLAATERNSSATCDTIFSFPVIDTWASGVAFDGTHFWSYGYVTDSIYKFEVNGTYVKSLPNPYVGTYHGGDLDFDGTHLWLVIEQAATAYQLDTSNGAILSQISLPTSNPSDPNLFGCAFDDGFLWTTEYLDQTLMKMDISTGILVDSFVINAPLVLALKIIDNELLGIGNLFGGAQLYHFDKNTGVILDSLPWCLEYPIGFSKAGNDMWGLGSDQNMDNIYKFGNSSVGVEMENTASPQFSLQPNPAASTVTISVEASQFHHAYITLTDLTGKVISKEVLNGTELTLSINDLSQGMYLVKLQGEQFSSVRRLVVIR